MFFQNLKERMLYFRSLTDYKLMPNSYVLVMLDGHSFSKKIKNKFEKPFDKFFINAMNETAKYLCEQVQGVKLAYTQSDEITLVMTDFDTPKTDAPFGYRICKMQSLIASIATSKFNQLMMLRLCDAPCSAEDMRNMIKSATLYEFDCKVWNVPNENDVYAWLLYRQLDCIRNSKDQAAQAYLSHSQLLGKTSDDQIALLKEMKGIDWYTDYTNGMKYGRFVYKTDVEIPITDADGNTKTIIRQKFKVIDGFPISNDGGKMDIYGMMKLPKPVNIHAEGLYEDNKNNSLKDERNTD